MSKLIILIITAIVLVGVVVFLFTRETVEAPVLSSTPILTPTPTSEKTPIPLSTPIAAKAITYSDSGYSPTTMTIKKGDTVIFDNQSSKMMWTASAVHPTHKAYPGSDITKCGTAQAAGAFDACQGIGLDESWEFKFDETGTWRYHNHLQPNHTGTVVIE